MLTFSSIQFSSVAQSCPTLCDPMNRSTPGLPVHHQLLEFTQSHVHRVSDAIQPSHPLSSPSPPAPMLTFIFDLFTCFISIYIIYLKTELLDHYAEPLIRRPHGPHANPWTMQSMKFCRPEYRSGQPFPSPGDLPNPWIEPRFPALQADSLPVEPQGKPNFHYVKPLIRRPQRLSLANMGILL